MSKEQIDEITKQLYPTGRAFGMIDNSVMKRLHDSLNITEATAFEDGKAVLNHILPDNADFDSTDADLWEKRLGLITNTATPLADRMLAIKRKLNYPGDIKPRQSHDFLQDQLDAAGFNVFVHENIPAVSVGVLSSNSYNLGASQLDEFQLNSFFHKNKVINHIDETKDEYFPVLSTFERVFIISGSTSGTNTNVPLARKDEFRQLILKVKPVQSIAYLYINYV